MTRIASAPDPTRPWQNNGKSADILTPWSQQNNTLNVPQSHQSSANAQANRLHIQYHLSSIFPEDQVLMIMQMYPDETNPQNICAAILNMFPRN